MRLHRLLGEEQPLADLPVDEPVGDQLEDLDLAHRRFLLQLPQRRLERDHIGLVARRTPARCDLLEAAGMVEIPVEDLLTLCSVHGPSIGLPQEPL